MKSFQRILYFIALLAFLPACPQGYAATTANELYLVKRNAANTKNEQVVIPSDTGKFIRADGTAVAISGSAVGDMLQENNLGDVANKQTALDTLTGGATLHTGGAGSPSISSTLSARAGAQGLAFNGTAGATIANLPAYRTGDFSEFAWVTPTGKVGYLFGAADSQSFFWGLRANGDIYSVHLGTGFTDIATALVTGRSYLVGYSRTGGTGTWIVDGVVVGAQSDNYDYTTARTQIGSHAGATFFTGELKLLIENRALTVAESVSLYEHGVAAAADLPSVPAGTALLTGDDSTFTGGIGNWVALGVTSVLTNPSTNLVITSASNGYNGATILSKVVVGTRYRATLSASVASGTLAGLIGTTGTDGQASISLTTTPTAFTVEFVAKNTGFIVGWYTADTTSRVVTVDSVTLTPIGALACYSDTQPGRGSTWYDVSGNSAHITLPAGVTWAHPSSLTTPLGGGATIAATAVGAVTVTPKSILSFNAFDTPTEIADTRAKSNAFFSYKTDVTYGLAVGILGAAPLLQGVDVGGITAANLLLQYFGGKVGIGMTPVNTLDVSGNIGATGDGKFGTGSGQLVIGGNALYPSAASLDAFVAVVGDANAIAGFYAYGNLHATKPGVVEVKAGGAVRLVVGPTGNATLAGSLTTQGGTASTPAASGAAGVAGTVLWDASYVYVCVAANTWKRSAITTW